MPARLTQLCVARPAWLALGLLLPLVHLACDTSSAGEAGVTHPTMIEVNPQDYLGNVPCSDDGTGMRRYVATLYDVTDVGAGGADGAGSDEATAGGAGGEGGEADRPIPTSGGFQLPSSPPTPCGTSVGFGYVVPYRLYSVEFDGYDRDDIEPRGSGTRQMVTREPNPDSPDDPELAVVTVRSPKWSIRCGGALASAANIVRARGCVIAPQVAPDAPASVRFDSVGLLGNLACGSEESQVERLTVSVLDGDDETEVLSADCGEELVLAGLQSGRRVHAYVKAFSAGRDEAFAGALCQALPSPGATIQASCTRLNETGTLRVDLTQALTQLGLACDASISEVRVKPLNQTEQRFLPPRCLQPFDYDFVAGNGSVAVTAFKGAEQLGALSCNNVIAPGRQVTAICGPANDL